VSLRSITCQTFLSVADVVRSFAQIDLAPYVGASLDVMKRDAAMMREGGPTIFASIRHDDGVQEIKEAILGAWKVSGAQGKGRPLGNGKGKARA
jgi:urease accessory protein